ncbi:RNA polymerase sigma factor, sigma-70 family protein [Janthinobacterium agaricidamnosum NBRC 102515 = DSM 9628]|uniref:RNA polymerase sigma factor, sigma-70 family protein n=1 Tax=Janthinobacterium agaricidamnosum NBRC 102515 = DSM 9628 TaxID=1349767 RepID=W0VB00_9BURK|nr:RNA polymerase sigma factor, sigma-70 family protein [Janthinobacterium agaricidamnosum NBRC 102515 = DSM 9628]
MVARYYRELLNFLARALNDRDAAADLAQESYARVLEVQRSGAAIAEPRALLYRTARNLVIDRHRRNAVRGAAHHAEAGPADRQIDALAAPSASEPEAVAASAQAVEAILAAIGALPLRCRQAFILHKFDGLSQAEVARSMGISIKMVERHIKLGLEACRRCRDRLDGAAQE